MPVIDLTHTISVDMPVYPGTEPPQMVTACTLEKDRFVELKVTLYSHTGTHMDAPAHIFAEGKTVDSFPVSAFTGPAAVLDVSRSKTIISLKDLNPFAPLLEKAEFVLLYTGWSAYWNQEAYFSGFPVLAADAAQWLAGFNLKGLGVDAISVDDVGTTDFPVHKIFLAKNTVIIENLTNLQPLTGTLVQFSCFPLKIRQGDGSPVRAVAAY